MAKILVVEDDASLANMIAELLRTEQHAVDVFDDGMEAATQLCSGQYDLAILDWDLPGKPGIEVCRAYRAAGGRNPVLMLTGRDKTAEKEEGFEAGADDYLTKPFSLQEFRSRIKALLRRAIEYAPATQPSQAAQPVARVKYCPSCHNQFEIALNICPNDGKNLITRKADQLIGSKLDGRYTLLSCIGRGGMAVVYKARQELLNRMVAVKVINARLFDNPSILKRLRHEAAAIGRLSHPNIISVHDFGMAPDGSPYLVMDLLSGKTLYQILQEEVQLDVSRTLNIFMQICEGMAHAHQAGIVHRDLKPGNLMILNTPAGQDLVKILDFGLAKILPEAGLTLDKLTQSDEYIGTCYYMSPEQCSGDLIDLRSDIYSLGCVLYEMLMGLPPIRGANPLATIQMHLTERPLLFRELRPDLIIPERLEQIVMRALGKDYDHRYQSMSALKQELEELCK